MTLLVLVLSMFFAAPAQLPPEAVDNPTPRHQVITPGVPRPPRRYIPCVRPTPTPAPAPRDGGAR